MVAHVFTTILIVITVIIMSILRVREDFQPWIVAGIVAPACLLGAPLPLFG